MRSRCSAVVEFERAILAGGIVLFPSDGVYGLACDPLDRVAIARIHAIKGRDDGKPSALMYFGTETIRELLGELGPRTSEAVGRLLPGPVTLVIANPRRRYPLACGDRPDRLGIRMIGGPLAGAACPVFQTSANRSGSPPVADLAAVDPAISAACDLVIDGGRLGGRPSTVVDLAGYEDGAGWSIIRPGALDEAALRELLD